MKKKIVYFDLDGVLADYYSRPNYKDNPDVPEKGFFESLDPIEGALDAFKKLSEHYDCYFLSTAPWSNIHALSEKRIWVEKHLEELAFKRLITTHHKNLQIGDYLIDDRTANGAGEFKGEHIHFGSPKFPNWEVVLEYLLGQTLEGKIRNTIVSNHCSHEDDYMGCVLTTNEIMNLIEEQYGKN